MHRPMPGVAAAVMHGQILVAEADLPPDRGARIEEPQATGIIPGSGKGKDRQERRAFWSTCLSNTVATCYKQKPVPFPAAEL